METELNYIEPQAVIKKTVTFKSAAGLTLLILLASVFIYSGYTKIHSENAFDSFQWTFLDLGVNSLMAAGIIARLMIGLEFLLALFLLCHIFLKRFTYPAVLAILFIFTIYLLFVLIKQGNTGNCGCFGDKMAMKPLAAILKNIGMMAVTVLLMFIYPSRAYKNQEIIALVVGMIALSAPFLLNMLNSGSEPVPFKKTIDLGLLYQYSPAPAIDLRKGKHIIAFMSLTCPHCKKAAYLLQIIHREHPDFPIFLVIDGSETFKKSFFEETHAEQVPHLLYYHTNEFTQMAGMDGVPAIYWVNNGNAEYKSQYAYYQLDPKYMAEWLNRGK